MNNPATISIKRKDGEEWERVVFAEVLIPDVPNVYGDLWSKKAVREAAYEFLRQGYGIDVDHDNVDVSGPVHVVESFIVRPGDEDFIEGSWVVAMRVEDDVLWQKILDNEINGYSYEAMVSFIDGVFVDDTDDGTRTGYTEPDVNDGHKHAFAILVDAENRPLSGGTDEVNGHSHTISNHTVTNEADGHTHRFNIVTGKD